MATKCRTFYSKVKGRVTESFSVDRMMQNVALSLIRDFQHNLNEPDFCSTYRHIVQSGNIVSARSSNPAPDSEMPVAQYKATYQIQSLFKRYRFSTDLYSDQELITKAIDGFRETQDRIARVDLTSLSAYSQVVLDLAAIYVAKVLGPYDDEEHRSLCRFGRRASVGVPSRKACLAARYELPISGSQEQITWFDSEMSQDCMVQDYWAQQKSRDPNRSTYQETSSLKLTLVPKTFKSFRSIMPNTTIGSYISQGLGSMIRKRLKREGYDISTLQERHKYLAKEASVHGLHATADLSSASDSITVALVERLFPSDWFEILNRTRIGKVELPDGTCIESNSFCTMGIGYTFPLQTLVFLALLKAIQALYFGKDRRTISVYGDDLIYASRMHEHVVFHFQEIGFVINLDKTFHEGQFRESCGGDYYRGVDVRPFQPQNGPANVGKHAYEAILYKYVNCLLARWTEYEIGHTLRYLLAEITTVTSAAKLVPGDYPDDSGIKCPSLGCYEFLATSKVLKPKHVGHGVFRFTFLRLTPDEGKEMRHGPYYWARLRGASNEPDPYVRELVYQEPPCKLVRFHSELIGLREEEVLLITREDRPITTFRGFSGRRLRRTSTYVTISNTGRYTRQSGFSCFETRR